MEGSFRNVQARPLNVRRKKDVKNEELVIPLIKANEWRKPDAEILAKKCDDLSRLSILINAGP